MPSQGDPGSGYFLGKPGPFGPGGNTGPSGAKGQKGMQGHMVSNQQSDVGRIVFQAIDHFMISDHVT